MLFWRRHANFRRVENDIYGPYARVIKNALNSTIFWARQIDSSTQLRDASNFTLKYSSIFRRSVISTWQRVNSTLRPVHSTRRRFKNAIMTAMADHKMSYVKSTDIVCVFMFNMRPH